MRNETNSTAISSIAYDASTRRLRVKFRSGREYTYFNVPKTTAEQFTRAKSKGQFFSKNVQGTYAYRAGRSNKMIIPVQEYTYRAQNGKKVTVPSHTRTAKI